MYYRCTRSNPIHSLFCHIFHSSIRSVPFDVSGRKCVNVFFFSLHFFFHVSLQFIYLRSDYEAFNYLRGSNGWSAVLWWKMTSTASYQQGAGEEFLKRKCDWLIIFPFFFGILWKKHKFTMFHWNIHITMFSTKSLLFGADKSCSTSRCGDSHAKFNIYTFGLMFRMRKNSCVMSTFRTNCFEYELTMSTIWNMLGLCLFLLKFCLQAPIDATGSSFLIVVRPMYTNCNWNGPNINEILDAVESI